MNCEACGIELETKANGTPRYKCAIKLRPALPPLSVKCCLACWAEAVAAGAVETYHERAPELDQEFEEPAGAAEAWKCAASGKVRWRPQDTADLPLFTLAA